MPRGAVAAALAVEEVEHRLPLLIGRRAAEGQQEGAVDLRGRAADHPAPAPEKFVDPTYWEEARKTLP